MLYHSTGPSKGELLIRLRTARGQWEDLLAQIPPEQMVVPVINNGWSIKDAVSHITYYEGWLLRWLEDAVRGQVTVATHRDGLPVDERNAIVFQENKGRTLQDVLIESTQVFQRLLVLIELLPERDLLDEHRYERYIVPFWGESRPLWRCIAGDSYLHYEEHSATIRAWLARRTGPRAVCIPSIVERTGANVSSVG